MSTTTFTITKKYQGFPFAHRQHKHKGHCSLVHGHNWDFEFTFVCNTLDENGFVVDFGDLKEIKKWLDKQFDHTIVLNNDDPLLQDFLQNKEIYDVRIVENCGAEGLAKHVADCVTLLLSDTAHVRDRGLRLLCVTVYEDHKNSATCHV